MSWVDVDALVGVAAKRCCRAGSLARCARPRPLRPRLVEVARVTAVTALDRIGVPVFVAMRPTAAPGGVCVTAGKGWTPMAARARLLARSVEQAWASQGGAAWRLNEIKVADLLDKADGGAKRSSIYARGARAPRPRRIRAAGRGLLRRLD